MQYLQHIVNSMSVKYLKDDFVFNTQWNYLPL